MLDDVRRLLVRELEALAREVELFPDDETLWRTVPGVTNSAGNLAFHLGQAGYLRRALTGDARTSGAVSLRALSDG